MSSCAEERSRGQNYNAIQEINIVVGKRPYREAEKQAGLAHTRVANEKQLQKTTTAGQDVRQAAAEARHLG